MNIIFIISVNRWFLIIIRCRLVHRIFWQIIVLCSGRWLGRFVNIYRQLDRFLDIYCRLVRLLDIYWRLGRLLDVYWWLGRLFDIYWWLGRNRLVLLVKLQFLGRAFGNGGLVVIVWRFIDLSLNVDGDCGRGWYDCCRDLRFRLFRRWDTLLSCAKIRKWYTTN